MRARFEGQPEGMIIKAKMNRELASESLRFVDDFSLQCLLEKKHSETSKKSLTTPWGSVEYAPRLREQKSSSGTDL